MEIHVEVKLIIYLIFDYFSILETIFFIILFIIFWMSQNFVFRDVRNSIINSIKINNKVNKGYKERKKFRAITKYS